MAVEEAVGAVQNVAQRTAEQADVTEAKEAKARTAAGQEAMRWERMTKAVEAVEEERFSSRPSTTTGVRAGVMVEAEAGAGKARLKEDSHAAQKELAQTAAERTQTAPRLPVEEEEEVQAPQSGLRSPSHAQEAAVAVVVALQNASREAGKRAAASAAVVQAAEAAFLIAYKRLTEIRRANEKKQKQKVDKRCGRGVCEVIEKWVSTLL